MTSKTKNVKASCSTCISIPQSLLVDSRTIQSETRRALYISPAARLRPLPSCIFRTDEGEVEDFLGENYGASSSSVDQNDQRRSPISVVKLLDLSMRIVNQAQSHMEIETQTNPVITNSSTSTIK